MNKKLIALAIAGALAAPAAFADVTIYGQLNGSFDSVDNGTGGTRTSIINSNSSRLGFKGSENLGDGLSAVWQYESSVNFAGTNTGTATSTLASRDSFVGLSSAGMGTILVGRHDTPYKMATRGFDVFVDNIADNRTLMGKGAAAFDGRQGNFLAYVTPAMNGFTGVIAYVAGAEAASLSTQTKGSVWSLAGIYGDGPLKISAAYEVHDIGTAGTGSVGAPATVTFGGLGVGAVATPATAVGQKEKAYKIGAGYTFNDFTINGVYEHTNDSFGAAGANLLGHNAYYLAGKYAFGMDAVKLAYTKVGNAGAAGVSNGAKEWAVGYDHNLSKNTTIYALYANLKNDANSGYGLSGGADVTPAAPVTAGATASVFSLGLKHSF